MTADKIINFKRNFGMYISDLQEKKQLLQKAFTFNHRKRNGFVVDDADDFDEEKMNRSEFILEVMQNSRSVTYHFLKFNMLCY